MCEDAWTNGGMNRKSADEQKDRFDGMAVTKRRVRGVVDERKEKRDGRDWDRKCIAAQEKLNDADDRAEGEEKVKDKNRVNEEGVRGTKVAPGRFGAEPSSGDAAKRETRFE